MKTKKRTSNEVVNRYKSKTYQVYRIQVRKGDEQDIIEFLDRQESKNATIKAAIKQYMKTEDKTMLHKIENADMLKQLCAKNGRDNFSNDAYESIFVYFYNTEYYEIKDDAVTIEIEWMDEFAEWTEAEFLDHFGLELQGNETIFDLQSRYNDWAEEHYKPTMLDVLSNGNIITRENRWN